MNHGVLIYRYSPKKHTFKVNKNADVERDFSVVL